jgi:4Fe-4S ferredoxin
VARNIKEIATEGGVVLEQNYLTKTKRLEYDNGACVGCGICSTVCLKEAIALTEASVENGRLVERPRVEIDLEKCVLCGICAVFCPTSSLNTTVDGETYLAVVRHDAMPTLTRYIFVDSARCDPSCELKCREACPVDALTISTSSEGGGIRITDVGVDWKACIFCKQCEAACPFGLIRVQKPFEGTTQIDTSKCPEGCRACADACPSNALSIEDEKPGVDQTFCILCSACERVCPEDAISVNRTSVNCPSVRSGAWFKILEKLTSPEVLARELGIDASKRRKEIVGETYSRLLA